MADFSDITCDQIFSFFIRRGGELDTHFNMKHMFTSIASLPSSSCVAIVFRCVASIVLSCVDIVSVV